MKRLVSIFVLMHLLVAPVQANQGGIIVRSAAVYSEPSHGSKRVGQVAAGNAVEIIMRQGGWEKISSPKGSLSGWVRSYQVREKTPGSTVAVEAESDSRGFLAGLASLSRRASSFFKSSEGRTSSGTATIGVRGLSEDEIKAAKADFVEFEKMKLFASSKKRARGFAKTGGLRSSKIPHFSGTKK